MASNLQIIINGVDQASDTFGDVGNAMDSLTGKAGGLLSKGLGPLQSMLGTGLKVAAGVAATAVGGLAAGLASSVSDAADFQQGMADIQASMGASAEDTAKLKDLILDLGIDPKLKVSAEEAAQAIGQLGTAGVSIDDIMNGAARSTVLLANATGADFADAASIASDVSKLWSIDAGDLTHAVNGITAATVASKFNINDYRLALAQAGGVASTVGVSFDDFNTTIAAISPSFASGSDAGTSFKTFLQRLIPQSKDATEAMRDLGLITADGKNQFFTAGGQMKDMSDIVGLLNHAFSGLTEEQKNQQLSIIFGTDAMRAAAAMAGMTTGDFENLQTTMAKTDAAESAKTRMDTLKGSLEILSGTFDTLKLMVGDKFLPVLNDLVKRFNDFLGAQAPMIVEWAGQLATRLGDLVTNYLPIFVVKLGEWWQWAKQLAVTLLDVGNQVWSFLIGVKAALQPVIDFVARFVGLKEILLSVAAAFGLAAVASLASFVAALTPVIALLGSAVAIVTTLHGVWVNNFAGIRDIVGGVINYLYDRFHLLWDFIKLFGPGALQEIGNWVSGTETQFTNLSKIWSQVRLTAQVLFIDLMNYVRSSLPGWIATLQGWGAAAWQWIANATPIALNKRDIDDIKIFD
jgi:TP901 family phage tail tape measure protein